MIELSPARRRELRAAAHHLNPVVSISQKGLQPSVLTEIDRCLTSHELIKVRLYGIERDTRQALLDTLCGELSCAPVQQIGNLLVLWRERPAADPAQEPANAGAPKRGRGAKPPTKKQAMAATEARRRIRRS